MKTEIFSNQSTIAEDTKFENYAVIDVAFI